MTEERFGIRFRAMRIEAGLTHRGAAELLAIAPVTLHRWETGQCAPDPDRQGVILAILTNLGGEVPCGPEIVYGPTVEADGSRVTRIRRVDESTFTVRVPLDGMQSDRSTDVGWITEDDEQSVAASDRLLSAVLGAA